jgi:hypothetical protein
MTVSMAGMLMPAAASFEYALPAAFALAAAAGLLTGSLYRVGAAIMVSFVTVVAIVVIGAGEEWSFLETVFVAFGLITVVQLAYLLGVFLVTFGDRMKVGLPRIRRRVGVLDEASRNGSARKNPER